MKVERPRPRGLLRGFWWDYQTRHGLPGYYAAPALTAALLLFDTVVYTITAAHPAILAIVFVMILAWGAGLARWWISTGYCTHRSLIKVRCRSCAYVAFSTAQDVAERGMRIHLAETHGIEATADEIGHHLVDDIDEYNAGDAP